MNWNILKIFDGLFDQASKIVDETITTQEEKIALKNEIAKEFEISKRQALDKEIERQKLDIEAQKTQAKTIEKEIDGTGIQKNWRPILALAFGFIVICNMFLFPLINAFLRSPEFAEVIKDGANNDNFWNLLYIMIGGYTVGRTGEKMLKSFRAGKQIDKLNETSNK